MKTIITAIDNPKIYNEIKKNENIKIVGKDLIYKEAVLEILEKNKNIDLIILYEKILGEINFFELIKKIKNINKKIKIIIILENKNEKLENKLKKINIKNIYLKNKINSKKIIEIINEKNINKNKKIEKNNKKINNNKKEKNEFIKSKNKKRKEKSLNVKKYFFQNLKETNSKFFLIKKYIQNFINKFFNSKFSKMKEIKFKNKSKHNEKNKKETILILGNEKSGKTLVSLLLAQKLENQNSKISIVNLSNNIKIRNKHNKLWYIQKEIESELKKYNNKKSILNFLKNSKFENRKRDNIKNKNFKKLKKLKKEKNEKERSKIKKIKKIKKLNNNKLKNNNALKNEKQKDIKIKINKNKTLKKYKLKNNKKEKNNKKMKIKLNKNKLIKKYKLKINKKNNNKIIKYLKNKKIEKNKIENEKILKRIKNKLSKRVNENLNYYSNFNFIKKYEKEACKNYKEKTINIILKIIKMIQKETRYIIIELKSSENTKLTNEIIKKTDKIIILLEANYLGIKRGQEILKRLEEEKNIDKKSLHIVFNKIEKNKISNKILEEICKDYKIVGNIILNKNFRKISFYSILKNKNKVNLKI